MSEDRTDFEINLVKEIKFLKKSKGLLIFLSLFSALIFGFYSMTLPEKYLSKVIMVPSEEIANSQSLNGISNITSTFGLSSQKGPSKLSVSLAIMNSRSFLNSYAKNFGIEKFLFPDDWDNLNKKWKDKPPKSESIAKKISSLFIVKENRDVYTLEFEWTDPDQAAEWANNLIKYLNGYINKQDKETGEIKISFLESQLKKSEFTNINNILFRMIEEQIKKNMLADISDEYVFKILDEAIPTYSNHKPRKLQIIFLGFFVGLIFGVIYVYLRKRR